MTISRKLFLAALVLTGGLTQAISRTGFDTSLLKPWVAKAQHAVAQIATKGFVNAKALYFEQKMALKTIKTELKNIYKVAKAQGDATWFAKKQTHRAFRAVYDNWKKNRLFPAL